jgi:hypothetical protein
MSFDLDINNYTQNELAEMLELPPNYDNNILEMKLSKLRENIINNSKVNKDVQNNTINFLVKVKNVLIKGTSEKSDRNTFLTEKFAQLYNSNYALKTSELDDINEHMVQVRPMKPFLISDPGEFFPGVINPLRRSTIRKNLNIDSRFRENYYSTASSNFQITLPMNFDNVLRMQLNAIELPITYYNVSKQYGNNFFQITVNTSTAIVSIPDGNYTGDGIVNAINNQLTILGGDFAKVLFLLNINNNSGSGQMMVGPKTGETITALTLNFQTDRLGYDDNSTPLPLKFGWALGFRNGKYVNNLNYVSEGVVDMTGPRYIYLVIDDHNNNVNNGFYSAFNSSMLNNNILARISLQSRPFDVQISNNLNIITTPREYFGPVNLQNMTVQLLDEYGRILDLNNMDFSFCVTLITAYDV